MAFTWEGGGGREQSRGNFEAESCPALQLGHPTPFHPSLVSALACPSPRSLKHKLSHSLTHACVHSPLLHTLNATQLSTHTDTQCLTCSRILGLSALLQRSRAASISLSRCALRSGSGGVTQGDSLAPSSSRHADDCGFYLGGGERNNGAGGGGRQVSERAGVRG
jgi:hypothetical protein